MNACVHRDILGFDVNKVITILTDFVLTNLDEQSSVGVKTDTRRAQDGHKTDIRRTQDGHKTDYASWTNSFGGASFQTQYIYLYVRIMRLVPVFIPDEVRDDTSQGLSVSSIDATIKIYWPDDDDNHRQDALFLFLFLLFIMIMCLCCRRRHPCCCCCCCCC